MIELEKRPIEWLYYKIKTMDDYDMRKLLSEELLKREVNNEISCSLLIATRNYWWWSL